MSYALSHIVDHLDEVLAVDRFRDYGPNGLQVEASSRVTRVVTGVSANLTLFEAARAAGAELVVVHHGLIWGGGIPRVTGADARRLAACFTHGISLAAYHLPLDKHETLGNNAGLADCIGLDPASWRWFGAVRGVALGLAGTFPGGASLSRDAAVERIGAAVLGGAAPTFVLPHGPSEVRTIGLCTGAASDLLEDAARAGCDVFVTGELAERAAGLAAELGITLVGAGHHRTEVFGVQRLAKHLRHQFPELDVQFVDVPSPL